MDAIDRQKSDLRLEVKNRRSSRVYDAESAGALCVQMAELCLMQGVRKIACYLAYGDEPDTELFIDWAIENDIQVVLPISKADGELDWVVFDGETQPGIYGFPEPVGLAANLSEVDLVFVPALAVDRAGQRLGKGKGYYDRALSESEVAAPVIAVVFEDEILSHVPTEAHDRPVDAAVTPKGFRSFTDRLK